MNAHNRVQGTGNRLKGEETLAAKYKCFDNTEVAAHYFLYKTLYQTRLATLHNELEQGSREHNK